MKCPIDTDIDLVMTDRQGIEIDYCPKCRGVWLDRGELDKLIDRSATAAPAPQQAYQERSFLPQRDPRQQHGHDYHEHRRDDDDDDDRYRHGHGYRKRKSFLSDVFDF
jgi:uncharacterized protein